jgi:TM2 domain-containing membrane protein YozV
LNTGTSFPFLAPIVTGGMDATRAQPSSTGMQVASNSGLLENYATAVVLSGVLGFIGLQHFYLGRWAEGLLDVGLSIGWICALAMGEYLWFALFAAADVIHAFTTTVLLLIGSYRDSEGRRVCYPGQKLSPRHIG